MNRAIFSLVFTCFADVIGQGLAFPIFAVILMQSGHGFLSSGTSPAHGSFLYGVAVGTFFLTWFFGSLYISRLSDSIGRKAGILICLLGAIAGYAVAVIAIMLHSFSLLVASRAITGFTAGAQPIVAAAMIDLATNDEEKTHNLGLATVGMSFGLVIGPVIGGLFSDAELIGPLASFQLPFIVGGFLCFVGFILIYCEFKETENTKIPMQANPMIVFSLITQALGRKKIMTVTSAFFPYMLCVLGLYVFAAANLTLRFEFDTLLTSLAMLLMGVGLAGASAYLVEPLNNRFSRKNIMTIVTSLFCILIYLFIIVPWGYGVLCLMLPAGILHGIGYPTMLTAYSKTVTSKEQGWVMGFATSTFTIAASIISFLGGQLSSSVSPAAPFQLAIFSGLLAVVAIMYGWNSYESKELEI